MTTPASEPVALQALLNARLADRDRAGAVALALEYVREGRVSIPVLYAEVLAPVMVGVGNAWARGKTTVWEEHFSSATVRTIIEALYPEVMRLAPAERTRGTAVLACPPEEQHDLGLRMLSDRMELAGWRVTYLGSDTPLEEIAAAARAMGADTVVLSGSTHYHRTMLRSFVDALKADLPGVRVLLGGAAFQQACDGWCEDDMIDPEDLLGPDG